VLDEEVRERVSAINTDREWKKGAERSGNQTKGGPEKWSIHDL
jgi:hypothetical protein